VIVFFAIAWGIAATFILADIVSLNGMDLALSYPAIFGNIALSKDVTESTSCAVDPAKTARSPAPAEVLVGAWSLGVSIGRDAVFRQFAGSNAESLAQQATGRNGLADRLRVPRPTVFMPAQLANANTEFVAFVEGDAGETAHSLATTFSSRACELYKMGALWGYSEMVRPALPGERAIFSMEIRHHAQRAEMPEPLWNPMLQRIPKDAKPQDVVAQMSTLTNEVTTYLSGTH
jgi:hypothetical protein